MDQSDSKLRFTHLQLENWKNFSRAEFSLQRRMFIVGPNASGKSNLLDVFRFLHDLVDVGGGLAPATFKRGGVSKLRSLSARNPSDIVLHVQVGNEHIGNLWEYQLHVTQEGRGKRRPRIKKEIARYKEHNNVVLDRPDVEDERDPERLTETSLEQVTANKETRELAEFFRSIRYLHLVPQLVREPERYMGIRKASDPFGSDFLEQVARTPQRTQESRLKKIRSALQIAVPQLRDLKLEQDETGKPHLVGKYEHWRPKDARQNETQFSDGTLRLLGLLWSLLESGGPLLLEEPELSLHPYVVRYLPAMIARMQRQSKRQVLISTHSADLLKEPGIAPDEILTLSPGSKGTEVQVAADNFSVQRLLEAGEVIGDVLMPVTKPRNVDQLSLFP